MAKKTTTGKKKIKCTNCAYFRKGKRISSMFSRQGLEFDKTRKEIIAKEDIQETIELKQLSKLVDMEEKEWGFRPIMTDHCGRWEDKDIYEVYQLKNQIGKCEDYENRKGNFCGECIHYYQPPIVENMDTRDNIRLLERMVNSGMSGMDGSIELTHNVGLNIKRNMESKDIGKSTELSLIYSDKGILRSAPRYFAYCKGYDYSEKGGFVICEVWNINNECQRWKSSKPEPEADKTPEKENTPVPSEEYTQPVSKKDEKTVSELNSEIKKRMEKSKLFAGVEPTSEDKFIRAIDKMFEEAFHFLDSYCYACEKTLSSIDKMHDETIWVRVAEETGKSYVDCHKSARENKTELNKNWATLNQMLYSNLPVDKVSVDEVALYGLLYEANLDALNLWLMLKRYKAHWALIHYRIYLFDLCQGYPGKKDVDWIDEAAKSLKLPNDVNESKKDVNEYANSTYTRLLAVLDMISKAKVKLDQLVLVKSIIPSIIEIEERTDQ